MKPLAYFNFSTQQYQTTIEVDVLPLVNSISVKNDGTSVLNFQGDPIQPGQYKTVGGNYGEILRGRVLINFTGAGVNLATVTQKFYLPDNQR